jgi:hypothetical protein
VVYRFLGEPGSAGFFYLVYRFLGEPGVTSVGGGMDVGQVEESEEEHYDWRDYLRVKDYNF